MTPAQVAHIMTLVEVYVNACFHLASGKWAADGSALRREHEAARAAVEAALRDAPQAEGWVMVDRAALHTVVNALRRDAKEGRLVRGEMADMLLAARPSAPTAVEPDERATCEWTLEDDDNGTWQSSCGELWSFIEGGPKENRVSFCHNCGKPAIVRASKGTK